MSADLLIIVILIIAGFGLLFFFLNRKLSNLNKLESDTTLVKWLSSMQNSLETTKNTLNESMQANTNNVTRTLQENSKQLYQRLEEVGRGVGQMNEIGHNMQEIHDFLKSPKLRGNMGEQVLTDFIKQIFPKNSFHLQYAFKSGEKVDVAIQTDAGIIPVDAKFPMENFQKLSKAKTNEDIKIYRKEFSRDIKKHIDAIAKKYILPEEGTMDYAVMYVPSESIFYEIVVTDELMEYARQQRVFVVSPTTLNAFLQTILLSYEGRKIEEQSKEVLRLLRGLQIDYEKVHDNFELLGKHLGNARSQYDNVNNSILGFGQKISTIKQLDPAVQKEKPKQLEME